jgi:hypothetical protein
MTNEIDFDSAVAEATALAQSSSRNQLRLGFIGANVKTVYGAKTLNHLAKLSGIPLASFRCYVAVVRAYKPDLLQTLTFSVAQALASHPDRVSLLTATPNLPVAAARKLARQYKLQITVPLTEAEKLGAAFLKVNRAICPLLQLAGAQLSSSVAASAISTLADARDQLQMILLRPCLAEDIVLPDPASGPAGAVFPRPVTVAAASAPIKTKRARAPKVDDMTAEQIARALSGPNSNTDWLRARGDHAEADEIDKATIARVKKGLRKDARDKAKRIARETPAVIDWAAERRARPRWFAEQDAAEARRDAVLAAGGSPKAAAFAAAHPPERWTESGVRRDPTDPM